MKVKSAQGTKRVIRLYINCSINGRSIKWRSKLLPLDKCKSMGNLQCSVAHQNRFWRRTNRVGLGEEGGGK